LYSSKSIELIMSIYVMQRREEEGKMENLEEKS
jgi:hypothetical protein